VSIVTADEITAWLTRRFAENLGVPEAKIRPDAPIIRYPIDSVELIGISGDLLEWLKLSVEPEEIAARKTIASLAELLAERCAQRP
jgi:acyl carrier protein